MRKTERLACLWPPERGSQLLRRAARATKETSESTGPDAWRATEHGENRGHRRRKVAELQRHGLESRAVNPFPEPPRHIHTASLSPGSLFPEGEMITPTSQLAWRLQAVLGKGQAPSRQTFEKEQPPRGGGCGGSGLLSFGHFPSLRQGTHAAGPRENSRLPAGRKSFQHLLSSRHLGLHLPLRKLN